MGFVRSAGGPRINVSLVGAPSRPVIMFAHSIGCDLTLWDRQVAALKNDFHIVRYDARGHGLSDAPPGEYTISDLAADALSVLDAFELQSVHLCGLSLGGTLGQWLALHAPQRLASLILCNTSARLGTAEGWQSRIEAVQAGGTASIADMSMTRFFSDRFRAQEPETVGRFRETLIETPDNGFAGCCAVLRDCDFRAQLGDMSTPTLVIAGALDLPTPVADSEELVQGMAKAKLVVLEAGHISAVEAPKAFNAVLRGHIDGMLRGT
jgi:3-oxoadipate enol-lactonase